MTAPRRQNVSQKATELVRRIYAHHGAGCCWHVVTDDGNWDCIDYCREFARANSHCETHGACQELGSLDLSPSILARAVRNHEIHVGMKHREVRT